MRLTNLLLPSVVLVTVDSDEEVCGFQDESCSAAGLVEPTLSESFLQSQFFNNPMRRFRITAEGNEEESVNLLNLKEEDGIFRRSVARAQSFKGHTFLLRRVIEALEHNETDDKPRRSRKGRGGKGKGKDKDDDAKSLEKIVDGFIDSQSESTDACHSQLFEARHQLNQLHDIVINLAQEVNHTEQMIVVFDKDLQEKIKELEELEKWKVVEIAKCQKKKDEAIEMFRKLSIELEEMHQIASPDVAMDINGRLVHDLSFLQGALLKGLGLHNESKPLRGPLGTFGYHSFDNRSLHPASKLNSRDHPKHDIKADMKSFSSLVAETSKASLDFLACKKRSQLLQQQDSGKPKGGCGKTAKVSVTVGKAKKKIGANRRLKDKMKETYRCSKVNPGYHGVVWLTCGEGEVTADTKRCFASGEAEGGGIFGISEGEGEGEEGEEKSSEECLKQKEELEKIYVKAYVELSRLKTEYDELANSTACFDGVNSQYKDKRAPLQERADELAAKIAAKVKELESLKPRLESASKAEEMLRKQVKTLSNQCKQLGPTISDLDKVRDAIRALSECPGLSRAKFSLPKWTGEWVRIKQTAKGQSDDDLDKKMNQACNKKEKGTRAAEVGEIEEATVLGIPRNNTAPIPLIGTCPNCEGNDDKSRASGHLRKCWRVGKPLTMKDQSEDCGEGQRVVLCVIDNPDIREIPGEKL